MFLSMTGFGRASRNFPWGTAAFEITSVNHRYQESAIRLPKELASLESRIAASLRSALRRGKVRFSAEIAWAPGFNAAKLNEDAIFSYCTQLKGLSDRLGIPAAADLASLLVLPGVCDFPNAPGEGEDEEVWDALLGEAVSALMEMKKSEGAKLAEAVESDLAEFARLVGLLSARWDIAAPEALDALKIRVEKVMERFGADIDPNRAAQEVSLLADKWDVSEELTRLSAHIAKFREIASGKESEGRKLDFLIQEMNREVNTMGSKVNDAEFRWMVVEAKSCLERIREQIQNVE
ncbi:MAG: YicC family protein [Synergistaceae bacterium]|jgi:uncharacterized protein (TIGR00255 family)|nr:YicC family protein [Synergistaceae bacterium]